MTTIRAAFYARVSGEQQAAAHTIESQIAALSERRLSHSPLLDRLRDLVSVAIDRIYVHSSDRLARNYAYHVLLLDKWQRAELVT